MTIKNAIKKVINALGFELRRHSPRPRPPVELSDREAEFIYLIREQLLSMCDYERLWATALACKHVAKAGIAGDFVECGVWRGGNALIAAFLFKQYGQRRRIFLYDTFAGMTSPTANDGQYARKMYDDLVNDNKNEFCYASLNDVRNNFRRLGLLDDNVVFVQGDVKESLERSELPSLIAVLRLDTDWYESTKKELEVLYPRLSAGGVLIVDDYGTWQGSRTAVDEYFSAVKRPLFHYTDDTGRMGVK